jgi:hypothetical protein
MLDQSTVARICEELASGRSLRSICDDEGMPCQTTVFKWLAADKDFAQQYARAREAQADAMLEEILAIADEGKNDTWTDDDGVVHTDHDVIARSRLRVDARKWAMSKMAPKRYGEKVTQELSGPDGGPIPVSRIVRSIVDPGNSNGSGVPPAA